MSEAKAAIAVVHWGGKTDTIRCLQSVAASKVPANPLLVIDNGTAAIDQAEVTAAVPGAVFVHLPQNMGFAAAANLAIRRALGTDADFVLLLNNDAVLDPDCLGELIRVARTHPDVGAVGAKVVSAADPRTLWMAYGELTYRAALVRLVGKGALDGESFSEIREVDSVPGCAMLLTRAAIEKVGVLDDGFFAYHEDLDWCTAARAQGFRMYFAPAARVVHRGGASLASNNDPVHYLTARNTILFARKHARLHEWLRLAVTIGGSLAREYVRGWLRGNTREPAFLLRGYVDGLRRREVPYESLGLRPHPSSVAPPRPAGAADTIAEPSAT
jgi:GT2 family glycosyltransferase